MIRTMWARLKQGYRTGPFPVSPGLLPERYLGRPELCPENCRDNCGACRDVCPTGAVSGSGAGLSLDMGKCLFCGSCQQVCADRAIHFTRDYRLAARNKSGLKSPHPEALEQHVSKKIRNIFGRSLKLRQVSAGGCNACELDINVLNTLAFDLGRFGIQFVASPRHADGLVVTGPVTENMKLALEKTYLAVPPPKIVIAVGACAVSGGPYAGHSETASGVDALLPVDLYVPGCPPHPLTILEGLLRMTGHRSSTGCVVNAVLNGR